MTVLDVTDASFETDVIERSKTTPVIIDLWASWCQPCKTLGPILERVVNETDGKVVLAKIDIDANPRIHQGLRVQSIPAVFVAIEGKLHEGFVGMIPEEQIRQFVATLVPPAQAELIADLLEVGDEVALRQALEVDASHPGVIVALAEFLVHADAEGSTEEALALLGRIPESAETRRVAALARMGADGLVDFQNEVEMKLTALLERVKDDEAARQEYIDTLELLGPGDERTARFRKQLTNRLF